MILLVSSHGNSYLYLKIDFGIVPSKDSNQFGHLIMLGTHMKKVKVLSYPSNTQQAEQALAQRRTKSIFSLHWLNYSFVPNNFGLAVEIIASLRMP